MNSLLWLIAVFAAAVAFVILGRVDTGYVLFVFPPYRVEVTMLFFAVAALAAFFILYALLRRLQSAAPRHIATARMLLRAERGAGAWDEVRRLAGQLLKRDAIAPALAEEYKVQANVELLQRSADDAEDFERRWREIAPRDQLHPRVAGAAARHATALGKAGLAREILEKSLAAEWNSKLIGLYGELPAQLDPAERGEEARVRIERAERC